MENGKKNDERTEKGSEKDDEQLFRRLIYLCLAVKWPWMSSIYKTSTYTHTHTQHNTTHKLSPDDVSHVSGRYPSFRRKIRKWICWSSIYARSRTSDICSIRIDRSLRWWWCSIRRKKYQMWCENEIFNWRAHKNNDNHWFTRMTIHLVCVNETSVLDFILFEKLFINTSS